MDMLVSELMLKIADSQKCQRWVRTLETDYPIVTVGSYLRSQFPSLGFFWPKPC